MGPLDSAPTSDELMSMESLKALVAANGARIARLCAELGVQVDAPRESTPPPTAPICVQGAVWALPVLVETSSTPALQPSIVPKPKLPTPTKCLMECLDEQDNETCQVTPTLLRDLSSPTILSFRSESMYLPSPPPHRPEQPCSGQILVPKSLLWPSFQFVTSLRCNTELWLADTQPWGRNAFSPGYDDERHMVPMLDDAIQTQSSSRTKSNSDILDSPITMQVMQHYEEECEQWDPGIHLVCGLLGNLIYFQGMQDIILSMQCTSWEFTVPPKWLSGHDGHIFVGGLLLHVFWTNLLDLVEMRFSFTGGIDGTTMGFYHGNKFQNSQATGGVLCNGVKRCREDDLLFIQVLVPVDFWCLGYMQAYLTKLWRCDYHRMINGDQANLSVAYESTRTCIPLAPSDILPSVSLLHAYWYCTMIDAATNVNSILEVSLSMQWDPGIMMIFLMNALFIIGKLSVTQGANFFIVIYQWGACPACHARDTTPFLILCSVRSSEVILVLLAFYQTS